MNTLVSPTWSIRPGSLLLQVPSAKAFALRSLATDQLRYLLRIGLSDVLRGGKSGRVGNLGLVVPARNRLHPHRRT